MSPDLDFQDPGGSRVRRRGAGHSPGVLLAPLGRHLGLMWFQLQELLEKG